MFLFYIRKHSDLDIGDLEVGPVRKATCVLQVLRKT